MNQAIQQMLSWRAQLAALMVVAALVAAAFAALSPVRAADGDVDAEEVSLQLLVHFPDDSDGVFPTRSDSNPGAVDRQPVEIELRVTVPYEGDADDAPTLIFGRNGDDADERDATPNSVTPFGATSMYPPTSGVAGAVLRARAPGADTPDTRPTINSFIGISGGLNFNDPQYSTLYLNNNGPFAAATDGPDGIGGTADDTEESGRGFDLVLDCSADVASTNQGGNRLRTDQTADSKRTVTKSCFVRMRSATGTDLVNPRVFLVGAADDARYTISASLDLVANMIAVQWTEATGENETGSKAFSGPNNGVITGNTTLRIDDGEDEVVSSVLSLATNGADGTPCGSVPADAGKSCPDQIADNGSETTLNLSITNSEGAASNWGGIAEIQIQTNIGDIQTGTNDGDDSDDLRRDCFDVRICRWTISENPNNPWGAGISASAIPITLKSKRGETGTARVTAIVRKRGAGGYLERDDDDVYEIKIVGPAQNFSLMAPTSTVHYAVTDGDNRDQIKFGVSATDRSGETISLTNVRPNWKVTNAAGQNKTDGFEVVDINADDDDSPRVTVSNGMVTLAVTAADSAGGRLDPGVYTFEATGESSGGTTNTLKDTAQFTVVGPPDGVTLTYDPLRPSGRLTNVTLSVSVNDAAGNPVADGTNVSITLSPAGGGIAALHDPNSGATLPTKNGSVSRDVVVVTSGTTVVTATVGGKVDTVLIPSTAEAVEEIHDITGLTRLSGFSGWTPQNPTTAPQLFNSLRTRGVGIIWKWDAATEDWFRYAAGADGRALPGANTEFEVARGDILYIGGTN